MANLKRTMTLNLTEAEMDVLEQLSKKKELSKTTVLRQALRLYQVVEVRVEKGDKLFFEDDKTKEKAEVMML
ncbi:MAG: transcriptional regulator [bacterium]|nr:transcriptional regulator [bacterium]